MKSLLAIFFASPGMMGHRSLMGMMLLCLFCLGGCKEEKPEVINKLDPRLKIQVEQLESTMLSVIVHTAEEINDKQIQKLESLGVVIQSRVGTVNICKIPLNSMLPVAREKFVTRLEAPKELKPLR